MTTLTLAAATSLAVLSLGIAVLSLLLHYARGQQHPDVTAVSRELAALRAEHLDLWDKVEHWRKRDNVRRARAGKESAEQLELEPGNVPDIKTDRLGWKAEMRKRLHGV